MTDADEQSHSDEFGDTFDRPKARRQPVGSFAEISSPAPRFLVLVRRGQLPGSVALPGRRPLVKALPLCHAVRRHPTQAEERKARDSPATSVARPAQKTRTQPTAVG